jgi:hypothetical protein
MKKDFYTAAVSGIFEFSGNGLELGETNLRKKEEKIPSHYDKNP